MNLTRRGILSALLVAPLISKLTPKLAPVETSVVTPGATVVMRAAGRIVVGDPIFPYRGFAIATTPRSRYRVGVALSSSDGSPGSRVKVMIS